MGKKIVIIDPHSPQLENNKLFNRLEAEKVSHTLYPVCYLYEEGIQQGISFITQDIYLQNPKNFPGALLISYLVSPTTDALIAAGARPFILLCQESPFIATRFFINLKKYSGWFKHSFLFSGMKKKVSKKTIFHTMYFPQFFAVDELRSLPFESKKMLTIINRASGTRDWKKLFSLKISYGWQVKEINSKRWEAIKCFAAYPEKFDLYGSGWDKPNRSGIDPKTLSLVYKGVPRFEDKIKILQGYKFILCFENSIFPGYVTEKIFDAMAAGSVPVYIGAPDIEDFVPSQTFIDYRKFGSPEELNTFLTSIDEATYNGYLENIKTFLHSNAYRPFTQEAFAEHVLELINIEN